MPSNYLAVRVFTARRQSKNEDDRDSQRVASDRENRRTAEENALLTVRPGVANMRRVLLVLVIAAAQASLGCAVYSRSGYLAAKQRYDECIQASHGSQDCEFERLDIH